MSKFSTKSFLISIDEGLSKNHTILGIHMLGNKGKIDTLGFIDAENDCDTAITHIHTRLSPDLSNGKIKSKQKIKLRACSN